MANYSRLDDGVKPSRSLMKSFFVCLLIITCCLIFAFALRNSEQVVVTPVSPTFEAFYQCVYPKLNPLKGNYEKFWFEFVNLTAECDDLHVYKALDIRAVENQDETKYVAYPKKDENITMVTVGVGHDVDAEARLKEIYPKTDFYGVDPAAEGNEDIYEEKLGGSFFPIAISGRGGLFKSHVFRKKYGNEMTMHIGADYFFGEMLRKKRIDALWIDNEGHEYTILDLIHRGGAIEKKGVKICQMNVEMHKETFKESMGEKQRFHDFVWRILGDGRYVMLKPFFVSWGNKGFIRTFIVNAADKECTDMYFS